MEKLTILYEDNHILVAIKPQNIPSQADQSKDVDMLSLVKQYIKEKYNKEGNVYVGLVHRLDRPTGGIMLFAKTSKAASRLSDEFKNNKISKTYYAVTSSIPKDKQGVLEHYLKKDEKNNIVKVVPRGESGAKEAKLYYKVLQTNENNALLEVKLLTGRSHQIRVQFSAIGCSLVGDNKYGKVVNQTSNNLALWAGRLEFIHPVTKEKMVFACPPMLDKKPWSNFFMEKYFLR